MKIENVIAREFTRRNISIIVAALDLYRDYLENDDHAPSLDQLPYTITDITNLFETFNSSLENK